MEQLSNHLKHKKRDMTLEELIGHMQIEEANRLKDSVAPTANKLAGKARLVEAGSRPGSGSGKPRGDSKKFIKKGKKPLDRGKFKRNVGG